MQPVSSLDSSRMLVEDVLVATVLDKPAIVKDLQVDEHDTCN